MPLQHLLSFSKSTGISSFHFHAALILLLVPLAVYRQLVTDRADPFRCRALLHTGRWLDGNSHQNWQPNGCMLYNHRPQSIQDCFAGRPVIFLGDSVTRVLFYGMVGTLDPTISSDGQPKHSDRIIHTYSPNIEWRFIWDPFLNSTAWNELKSLSFRSQLSEPGSSDPSLMKSSRKAHVKNRPALLVVGSGLWYLRHRVGVEPWKEKIDNLFRASLGHQDSIADEIVLLPVESPDMDKLSTERRQTITPHDVELMNAYTRQKLESSPLYPVVVPSVLNLMAEHSSAETKDGLHYSRKLAKVQAQILLNLRCNDQLPKRFPFDKTCCFRYPFPNLVQLLIIGWCFLVPVGLYLSYHPKLVPIRYRNKLPAKEHLTPTAILSTSVLLMFLADRTHLFLKEQKQYDTIQFVFLCLLALGVGVATVKTSEKGDLGFLNRDQTDEWKGWMQLAILIYHYLAASKVSGIYNPIRICVAGYLFMTGYGHFTFYYVKKDYSFARVLAVLVRLNLLTVVLSYLMDTDYLSYYFSPLVSMWYLVIWLTMWAGNQYNHRVLFMTFKLLASGGTMSLLFGSEGPIRTIFKVMNTIFLTRWVAREWLFRVSLDLYIVYFGMICSWIYLSFFKDSTTLHTLPSHHHHQHPLRTLALLARQETTMVIRTSQILSGLGLIWFFWFELSRKNKVEYNRFHPFVAVVPIVCFVVMRNSSSYLRGRSSRFFCFFGKCSLETFIIQFHFWLGGDTKGIMKLVPIENRMVNFVVSSLVFVAVSEEVAKATGTVTNVVCGGPKKAKSTTTGGGGGFENGGSNSAMAPAGSSGLTAVGPTTGQHHYIPISASEEVEDGPGEVRGIDGDDEKANHPSGSSPSVDVVRPILHISLLHTSEPSSTLTTTTTTPTISTSTTAGDGGGSTRTKSSSFSLATSASPVEPSLSSSSWWIKWMEHLSREYEKELPIRAASWLVGLWALNLLVWITGASKGGGLGEGHLLPTH